MTTKLAKHRPGPWKAVHDFDGDYAIFAEHGGVLASTYADTPEDEANARLLAAAPGLLEALKSCLSCLQMECDECYGECPCTDPCTQCRAKAAIRAAVGAQEENTRP